MLGNQGTLAVHALAVEVALRNRAVLERRGREEVGSEAMLLNELLGDNPEDFCPNLTDGMDAPVTRLVKGLVCRRINGLVLATKRNEREIQ